MNLMEMVDPIVLEVQTLLIKQDKSIITNKAILITILHHIIKILMIQTIIKIALMIFHHRIINHNFQDKLI